VSLSEFLRVDGYKITDTFKHLDQGYVLVALAPTGVSAEKMCCYRCGGELGEEDSRHRLKLKYLPLFSYQTFFVLWRRKGHCAGCKKIRSEKLSFISEVSPHLTKAYEKTIEELTEIAAVSGVADVSGEESSTIWRIDFRRMQRLVKLYKTPEATHISVDEVYARKKSRDGDTRNDRFFTIITDMKTRKVIWVTDSRRKEVLDAFYQKIGPEACAKIQVVAEIFFARNGLNVPSEEIARIAKRCGEFYWRGIIRQLLQVLQSWIVQSECYEQEIRAENLPVFNLMMAPGDDAGVAKNLGLEGIPADAGKFIERL
jgi:hypothetical protein